MGAPLFDSILEPELTKKSLGPGTAVLGGFALPLEPLC